MSIDKKRVVVKNTCGFDSIMCILASACIHQFYKNMIETSESNVMKFIKCFLDNGCCKKTYMSRAKILMNVKNFISEIDKNIITVNCYSSIGNVVQYIFQNSPSYTEKKYCNVCSKIIKRQSTLVPINVNLIERDGLAVLSNAITEGMPKNNSICCKQLMQRDIIYGTQIFIEYDPMEYNHTRQHCLADLTIKLEVNNYSFILAGVVVRYGSADNGHYVGYSYQSSHWIEFDDLKITLNM